MAEEIGLQTFPKNPTLTMPTWRSIAERSKVRKQRTEKLDRQLKNGLQADDWWNSSVRCGRTV